ncbi:MAG: hypothetical protein WC806_02640 [Candidatus Gracilibacteria bacterium]
MKKKSVYKIISFLLLCFGVLLVVSPVVLYWFIHGDFERYLWIINGSYPFSSFGSGPFQMVVDVCLFFVGIVMILSGLMMRKFFK